MAIKSPHPTTHFDKIRVQIIPKGLQQLYLVEPPFKQVPTTIGELLPEWPIVMTVATRQRWLLNRVLFYNILLYNDFRTLNTGHLIEGGHLIHIGVSLVGVQLYLECHCCWV